MNATGMHQSISRNIRVLNIDNLIHLQDQSLKWISTALPLLEELSMKNIITMKDKYIEGILKGCTQLIKLNINGCKAISNATLDYFVNNKVHSHEIIELCFAGIQDDLLPSTLSQLLLKNQKLSVIDASHNSTVTDEVFIELLALSNNNNCNSDFNRTMTASNPSIPSKPTAAAVSMNVSSTSLTSYGIACMAQVYIHVEVLDVSGLKHINDSVLKVIAGCCVKIRSLNLNDCKELTDQGIIIIAKYCRLLQQLHLSFSKIITDLRTSGGETYQQYTDQAIQALFSYATNLSHLSICNQLNLSFSSSWFKHLARRGSNYNFSIQKLDLRGCNNIVDKYLAAFFRNCYGLNDVHLPAKFTETSVSKEKFWNAAFSMKVYSSMYSSKYMDEEKMRVIALSRRGISTKKESIRSSVNNKVEVKTLKQLEGFHILYPHTQKDAMEYRDRFYSRRLLECYSARLIQHKYHLWQLWKRIRLHVYGQKIAYCYINYSSRKKFRLKVEAFIYNRNARIIQRQFYLYKVVYMNAAKCIQKAYRQVLKANEVIRQAQKNKVIVGIQRVARGYIVRTSERYTLAQLYLKLPSFWKEVMKIQPASIRDEMRYLYMYISIHPFRSYIYLSIISIKKLLYIIYLS